MSMTDIKAIAFDVGHTLIYYNNFLNWQALYSPAIMEVMKACNLDYAKELDEDAQKILTKYNTRVNYREYEVSSDTVFTEILDAWRVNVDKLQAAKHAFYSYFQRGAFCYDDTEHVLQTLKSRGIKTGILTDVAYGMDNEYTLRDLAPIMQYIDVCFTSNDIGYRKPNKEGYLHLQKSFNVPVNQIAFIGDEEKDIIGANNAGMISVLINRDDAIKNYSQNYTVNSLSGILKLIEY